MWLGHVIVSLVSIAKSLNDGSPKICHILINRTYHGCACMCMHVCVSVSAYVSVCFSVCVHVLLCVHKGQRPALGVVLRNTSHFLWSRLSLTWSTIWCSESQTGKFALLSSSWSKFFLLIPFLWRILNLTLWSCMPAIHTQMAGSRWYSHPTLRAVLTRSSSVLWLPRKGGNGSGLSVGQFRTERPELMEKFLCIRWILNSFFFYVEGGFWTGSNENMPESHLIKFP